MEFLKINASKLKITLSAGECEKYNIKENAGEFDSTKVRDAIGEILDAAGASDFQTSSEKLLVQLYPTGDGGAELFVTKLALIGERERRAVKNSDNLNTYVKREAHFLFPDFDTLIRAARAMSGKKKRSDLYLGEEGKYLLSVIESKIDSVSDCDVLSEFGTRLYSQDHRISPEWYKLLRRGDAIDILAKL